jgi:hypothetical protein
MSDSRSPVLMGIAYAHFKPNSNKPNSNTLNNDKQTNKLKNREEYIGELAWWACK